MTGEAGPAVDLDQQIGEVDLGQPLLDQTGQFVALADRVGLGDQLAIGQPGLSLKVTCLAEASGELGRYRATWP